MSDTRVKEAVGRIAALERDGHRQKRVGILAIMAAFALFLVAGVAKPTQRELNAKRVVLRDSEGGVRSVLEFRRDGKPTFSLLDGKERPLIEIGFDSLGGPILFLRDQIERDEDIDRVRLSVSRMGDSSVAVYKDGAYGTHVMSTREPQAWGEVAVGGEAPVRLTSCPEWTGLMLKNDDEPALSLGFGKKKSASFEPSGMILGSKTKPAQVRFGRKIDNSVFMELRGRNRNERFVLP